jgi:hypothetical protein
MGVDPWIGCGNNHILSKGTKERLSQQGITHLGDTTVMGRNTFWQHGWKKAKHIGLEGEEAN